MKADLVGSESPAECYSLDLRMRKTVKFGAGRHSSDEIENKADVSEFESSAERGFDIKEERPLLLHLASSSSKNDRIWWREVQLLPT